MADPGLPSRLEKRDLEKLFTASLAELTAQQAFPLTPAGIWTEEFFRANELLNIYTDYQVTAILAGFGEEPGKPVRLDPERLVGRGVAAVRRDTIAWLLAKASGSRLARTAPLPADFGRRLEKAILLDNPALAPCLKLVDLAASGYPGFLRGERDGRSILFSPATHDLWESYFDRQNPFYQPVNRLAAHAAAEAAEGRAMRILEVGAGCGSGTLTLLEALGRPLPAHYLVTDISPYFLRKARSRVEETAGNDGPGIQFRLLDLNRPRESWRIPDGDFDLVFAVNVLHCVRELAGVLSALRALLRPGGVLVLGEGLRPERGRPVHPEFIFQLLDEFRDVALDPPHRPSWGFLDGAGWQAALARAGFERLLLIPDVVRLVSSYPEHTIAAIVARS